MFLIKLSGDIEIKPGPKSDGHCIVKCVVLHARSLTSSVKMKNNKMESNLERFQSLVYSEDMDIVCVNENWLSGHVYNAEILHSGYCIIRKDRKTRGGGVLLGIKTVVFKSVCEIKHNHYIEIGMAELQLLICSCYHPPDADKTWTDKFESSSRCLQTSLKSCNLWRFQVNTSRIDFESFAGQLEECYVKVA